MNMIQSICVRRPLRRQLWRNCSTASTSSPSPQSDRLHSTDIAYKPSASGWGYSTGYATGFDNIFKRKNTKDDKKSTNTPASPKDSDVQDILDKIAMLSADSRNKLLLNLNEKYVFSPEVDK
mmetsp:Transcript_20007/g.28736  ORF Transcript_20007/g.28736 Transcript_20007/m.28736 type:complete len:122 (+) Transcript_20007:49-414(+)